jgi:hypothetical protein
MEKEFVPYEIALELKQLGFDEPCLGAFMGKDFRQFDFSNDLKGYVNDNNLIIGRPTYSQAFRWFREKYGLFHSTNYQDDNSGPGGFDYEILDKRGKGQCGNDDSEFKTYEEAELDCLKKLIEIVKKK